jgi:hypothetical protein
MRARVESTRAEQVTSRQPTTKVTHIIQKQQSTTSKVTQSQAQLHRQRSQSQSRAQENSSDIQVTRIAGHSRSNFSFYFLVAVRSSQVEVTIACRNSTNSVLLDEWLQSMSVVLVHLKNTNNIQNQSSCITIVAVAVAVTVAGEQ